MLTSQGLFLDAFILDKIPSTSPPGSIPKGYLAQSDLLDSAPRLAEHVPDLEHYSTGPRGDIFRRTIWIGPSGSWTPFHKDPYIGIYNQGTSTSFAQSVRPSKFPINVILLLLVSPCPFLTPFPQLSRLEGLSNPRMKDECVLRRGDELIQSSGRKQEIPPPSSLSLAPLIPFPLTPIPKHLNHPHIRQRLGSDRKQHPQSC